jgi:hypothetical protein
MNNYASASSTPEAFVTKGKQRVKQFGGTVYLKDGDNFEIELFNPTSNYVLGKISLDGKLISNSGLILRPGERVYLERYIDSNNKFLYSTYEVSGNDAIVRNAIRSNGNVKVEFYNEITIPSYTIYPSTVTVWPPLNTLTPTTFPIYGSGTVSSGVNYNTLNGSSESYANSTFFSQSNLNSSNSLGFSDKTKSLNIHQEKCVNLNQWKQAQLKRVNHQDKSLQLYLKLFIPILLKLLNGKFYHSLKNL